MKLTDVDELKDRTKSIVGDVNSDKLRPSIETETEIVRDALDEFSRATPRRVTGEVDGDGSTRRYVLTTILGGAAGWIAETSEILDVGIVYDASTDDERIERIAEDKWDKRIETTGAEVLYLRTVVPGGAKLRILYTRPHQINELDSAAETTVPEKWTQALVLLTAAVWAGWISRAASDLANETLGVDQVDYESAATRWARRSEMLRKQAIERMSPKELSAGSAGASIEYDRPTALGGIKRVSH